MPISCTLIEHAGEALALPTRDSGQGVGMASQDAFNPHTFLAHVGAGRTLAPHRRQSPIFAQGDVADAVFDIQRGQVKRTVVSARGKEAMSAFSRPRPSLGRAAWPGSRGASRRPRRSPTAC